MTGQTEESKGPQELRLRAEHLVAAAKPLPRPPVEGADADTCETLQRTVHELQVHQVELLIQNEELRRVQMELELARARYFDLWDLAPVGYCTLGENGLIVEANLTLARLLGEPRGALAKRPFSQHILRHDQDLYYLHRMQLVDSGLPQALDLRMVRSDGTWFWAHLETALAREADGTRLVRAMVSDVSERKKGEEERRCLEERVGQFQKMEAIGVLVAGVAHNINNVLAAIMGAAALRAGVARDPADKDAFGIIGTACRRGKDVVRSLILFAQPSIPNQSPQDLHDVVTEVRRLLESTTRTRIEIVEEFVGEPLWVHGDGSSISSAVMNICINSLDACPKGGRIVLRTTGSDPDWAEIAVCDDGEGIAPEVLPRVTEPFFTTKSVGKGTGLGLSMVHGVMKAHRGTLDIESPVGKGTTVKLRFPRIPAPLPAPPVAAAVEDVRPTESPARILVVDDEEPVRSTLKLMLETGGHVVDAFASGESVLERLSKDAAVDLVILDQNMPGMNGIETMVRIRKALPDLPILVSSGQLDLENNPELRRAGVRVLAKPFDMVELFGMVRQMRVHAGG